MLEKYYKYKVKYRDYVILFKVGSFYEMIGYDALIMNKLFNYKLKKLSNTFKCGFPIVNLNTIVTGLSSSFLNYVVVECDSIVDKKCFNDNSYNNYSFDENIILYNFKRIENIYNYLINNVTSFDINDKLEDIESIVGV